MGKSPVEQALVLNTADGLVVVTGCAHPGDRGHGRARRRCSTAPVDLVCGGSICLTKSDEEVEIIGHFRALGVKRVGATHCTGEKQIALIREACGADFVPLGVGRVLEFRSAPVGLSLIVKDANGRIVDSRREYVLKNVARFVEEKRTRSRAASSC